MTGNLNVITGATGLLGSHIAEQLVAQGARVRALVRTTSDTTFLRQLGVELVSCDLLDREALPQAVAGADIVYHCAARVGDFGTWKLFQEQVIDATRNILDACRAAAVGRVLYVSSVSVYGHPIMPPGGITEDHPHGQRLRFGDHYCRAKMEAERLASAYGPDVTIVRPTWLFGPRDRNSIPRVIRALRGGWISILGSGDNLLNIVHVQDVAEGAIRAANHPAARGQVYHLCSEGEVTQRQVLDALTDHLGLPRVTRHVPYRLAFLGGFFGEIIARVFCMGRAAYVSRYSVDLIGRPAGYRIDKARRELNWQPQTRILQGLHDTMAWLRQHEPALMLPHS